MPTSACHRSHEIPETPLLLGEEAGIAARDQRDNEREVAVDGVEESAAGTASA
jgi:hypothetical protein